jgi:hypothetical protein
MTKSSQRAQRHQRIFLLQFPAKIKKNGRKFGRLFIPCLKMLLAKKIEELSRTAKNNSSTFLFSDSFNRETFSHSNHGFDSSQRKTKKSTSVFELDNGFSPLQIESLHHGNHQQNGLDHSFNRNELKKKTPPEFSRGVSRRE